jgi:hypothetical protein
MAAWLTCLWLSAPSCHSFGTQSSSGETSDSRLGDTLVAKGVGEETDESASAVIVRLGRELKEGRGRPKILSREIRLRHLAPPLP